MEQQGQFGFSAYGQQATQRHGAGDQPQRSGSWGMDGASPQQPQQPSVAQPQPQMVDPSQFFQGAASQQMASMGLQYGAAMADQQGAAVKEAMQRFGLGSDTLRQYFNVDGSYVLARLKVMAFPFRSSKDWRRRMLAEDPMAQQQQQQQQQMQYGQDPNAPKPGIMYMSPREDENAPDLYIPTMAFITYILAAGFTLGVDSSAFDPEVLGRTGSFAMVLWLLEVLAVKFGLYLLHNVTIGIWDATAYAGYKFVGAVVSLLAYLLGGSMAYYLTVLYSGGAVGFMIFKSYKEVMCPSQYAEAPDADAKRLLLIAIGALQLVLTWFLGAVQ